MSLRAMRGLLFSSLVLGLTAVGCGDGDGNDNDGKKDASVDGGADAATDAGMDSSSADAAGGDGGADDPGDPGSCEGAMLVSSKVRACQIPAAQGGGCGLWSNDILAVNSSAKFPENTCLPKDAPGAASSYCGGFLDQVEPDMMAAAGQPAIDNTALHMNGGLDIPSPLGPLTFAGCCTPQGECGANLRSPTAPAQYAGLLDLHLGCMGLQALQESLGGGSSGGTPRPAPTLVPYCNPTSGGVMCPSKLGPICARVKTALPNFQCTETTDTPDWVCQMLQLPKADGNIPAPTCMAGLPKYARGCGATPGASCIANVPNTVFGCEDVAAGKQVPTVPVFVCGCGGPTAPEGVNCIPNVPPSVCGAGSADDAAAVKLAPKFACGCGVDKNDADTTDFPPCLPYTAETTCGEADPSDSVLARVPEFICGCVGDPFQRALCMKSVPVATCGTKETAVTTRAELGGLLCLVGIPEYAHGCGNAAGPSAEDPTCLRNAGDNRTASETVTPDPTKRLPGCVDVTAAPPLGNYLCGCGNTTPYTPAMGLPCLSFVAEEICGSQTVTASSQVLMIPNYACGCGTGAFTPSCLKNLPTTICGAVPTCATGTTPAQLASTPGACAEIASQTGQAYACRDKNGDTIADTCSLPPS